MSRSQSRATRLPRSPRWVIKTTAMINVITTGRAASLSQRKNTDSDTMPSPIEAKTVVGSRSMRPMTAAPSAASSTLESSACVTDAPITPLRRKRVTYAERADDRPQHALQAPYRNAEQRGPVGALGRCSEGGADRGEAEERGQGQEHERDDDQHQDLVAAEVRHADVERQRQLARQLEVVGLADPAGKEE